MKNVDRFLLSATLVVSPVVSAFASVRVDVGLGGSRASMRRQHEVARELELTFIRNSAQLREFARKDRLERLSGDENYSVGRVSFPYARAAVKIFIERLAAQYRAATGEKLVVTSLTRPITMQPRNASPLSVHPTGIAVDFRVPKTRGARMWLEETLLSLEGRGVLDATRERRPPHYHVAVFPDEYEAYVRRLTGAATASAATAGASMMLARVPTLLSARPAAPASLDTAAPSLDPASGATPLVTSAFVLMIVGAVGSAAALRNRRP